MPLKPLPCQFDFPLCAMGSKARAACSGDKPGPSSRMAILESERLTVILTDPPASPESAKESAEFWMYSR